MSWGVHEAAILKEATHTGALIAAQDSWVNVPSPSPPVLRSRALWDLLQISQQLLKKTSCFLSHSRLRLPEMVLSPL